VNSYLVQFKHSENGELWSGVVFAEDHDIAEHVALESLESDYDDVNPNDYEFCSSLLLEVCPGCGGWRKQISPKGTGAVCL